MKKKFLKIIKNPKLISGLSVIISILLLVMLTPSLLYPRFVSWRNLADNNNQEQARLSKITNNVSTLLAIDETNLDDFERLINKLIPDEQDKLRVTSILDQLIKDSGMKMSSLKIVTKKTPQSQSTTSSATQPTSAAQSNQTAQTTSAQGTASVDTSTPNTQATESKEYDVSLVAEGGIPQAIKLVDTLARVKRSIKVLELSVGKEKGEEESVDIIKVSISFTIPLDGSDVTVNPEELVDLTQANVELLQKLVGQLNIDAAPTKNPLGRPDPFK